MYGLQILLWFRASRTFWRNSSEVLPLRFGSRMGKANKNASSGSFHLRVVEYPAMDKCIVTAIWSLFYGFRVIHCFFSLAAKSYQLLVPQHPWFPERRTLLFLLQYNMRTCNMYIYILMIYTYDIWYNRNTIRTSLLCVILLLSSIFISLELQIW